MVDAMSAKVLALRDPGLLAWFDQKVPGKDYSYGDTPYGSKVKLETTSSLEVIARTSTAAERQAQKDADEKQKDAAQRAAIDFMSRPENAGKPIPEGLLKQGEVDPLFKVHVEDWRQTSNRGFSDPKQVQGVYDKIMNGGGMKAVTEGWRNGVFGRIEDLSAAQAFAKKPTRTAPIGSPSVTSSATFERFMKDLDIRTKGKTAGTFEPPGHIQRRLRGNNND